MKHILGILKTCAVYWLLIVFGPALVLLWNALSPGSYREGDLGYCILQIVAQSIACWIAQSAADHVSNSEHDICVLVNIIVCTVLAVVCFVFSASVTEYIRCALAFVTCVVGAYMKSKEISQKFKNTQEHQNNG